MAREERNSMVLSREDSEPALNINLMVVGAAGCGKTSFISRIYENAPPSIESDSCAVSSKVFDVECKNFTRGAVRLRTVDASISDLSDEECSSLFGIAAGVFLMYDVTSRQSFENVTEILMRIVDFAGDDAMLFFLANKVDSPVEKQVVTTQEGESLVEQFGGFFYEVSNATGHQAMSVFETMVYAVVTIQAPITRVYGLGQGKGELGEKVAQRGAPVELNGWIEKKSKYLRFWNSRYFTLKEGRIYFQKTNDGRIKTGDVRHELFLTRNVKVEASGPWILKIISPHKEMLLRFSSAELYDSWRNTIKKHCDYGSDVLNHYDSYAQGD